MNLQDALKKAKQTTEESRAKYRSKQLNRPISVTGLIQYLQEQLTVNNFGPMPPMTKENRRKINGFIKFLKNNGFNDKDIYLFIDKCVENWYMLQNIDMYTDKRKKYKLDTRPNLVDIIHCKTQIFNELNQEELDEEIDLLDAWGDM
jgi:hypothetical protein